MKIETNPENENTLICKKGADVCSICGGKNNLVLCSQTKKLYCFSCQVRGKGCQAKVDHIDYLIKYVKEE